MRSIEAPTYGRNAEALSLPKYFIGVNQTQYINDSRLSAERQSTNVRKVVPGETAIHEAKHAVAAVVNGTPVKEVTIIPGPGYLGLTELGRPDPIAAAAPYATGSKGGEYDVSVIPLMGGDVNSASSAGRSIIYGNPEAVEEVASVVEERKTITGYEVKQAMNRVGNKRKEGEKATVFIKNPDGREQRITDVNVKNGVVMVPGEWINYRELPKEGIIFPGN